MSDVRTTHVRRLHPVGLRWVGVIPYPLCLILFASSNISLAAGFSSPKECQSMVGDAHLNCLYTVIEAEQDITATEGAAQRAPGETSEQVSVQREQSHVMHVRKATPSDHLISAQAVPILDRPGDTSVPNRASPAECRPYTGPAHLNCLYAYIEIQQSRVGNVEQELMEQRLILKQLRDQMDRQASATQDQQRRIAAQAVRPSLPAPAYAPPPMAPGYGYSGYTYPYYGYPYYGYPVPSFSLSLGLPGFYFGRPFYGHRFSGPRFFGHHR